MSGVACVCDIHYQQSIVPGIDDSRAFQAQKRGYVDPATSAAPVASIASMPLYQGPWTVQNTTRFFFTRDEVKQNWKSRCERRIHGLGQWSVAATHSDGLAAIGIRLKNA